MYADTARDRPALVLIFVGVLLVAVAPAHAQQTRDQQKCTNAMNKDLLNVAKVTSKEIQACIADFGKGKLGVMTPEQCFGADRRGKIAKATTKTSSDFTKFCSGASFPPFGVTSASTVSNASRGKELALTNFVFGDPDTALELAANDASLAKCQLAVPKAIARCQETQMKAFNDCKKAALASATSAGDLADCVLADPASKIAKACNLLNGSKVDKIRKELQKCVDKGVDLSEAFPGCGGATVSAVHACVTPEVRCLTCRTIETADGLGDADCDQLDDGNANTSCQAGLVCGDGVIAGSEACDDGDTNAGDGCNASCQVESGWGCIGAPSVCTPVCGDGQIIANEECDDGGTMNGDGCSSTCQLESAAGLCAGVPATAGTAVDAVKIPGTFNRPIFVTSPPLDPNRVFIVEQEGRIRLLKNGVLLATPFLDIESRVACCDERGLFSVAFDANYESNGFFYVNYTNNDGDVTVSRFQVNGDPEQADEADDTTEHIYVTVEHSTFANHNGGRVAIGPDGALYASVGDGGSGGDPFEAGQDDGTRLGKLLRIDLGTEAVTNFAKGLRNLWRYAFDRANGDLYVADVGQNLWEEINYQPAPLLSGRNYGWDIFEATHCFEDVPAGSCAVPPANNVFPILEYCHFQSDPACGTHPRGCSVTGGFVYRGCAMPTLQGRYFYSDFCGEFVRSFVVSGGAPTSVIDHTSDLGGTGISIADVTSFGEDARGELYITDRGTSANGFNDGEVYRIVPGS